MKLHRVCTQNLNYPDILDYLDQYFPGGYTILQGNGAWQGVREKSLVIEIVFDASHIESSIGKLAYWLKKHNEQQVVLVQVIEVDSQLL